MVRILFALLIVFVAGCQSIVVKVDFRQVNLAYDYISQKMSIDIHPSKF